MPTRNNTTTKKKAPARKKKVARKKRTAAKSTAKKARVQPDDDNSSSVHTLKLDSVIVINNAKALYEEFAKAINTDVNIDASAVEMIDTAILQLLYAFVIKVTSTNHKINWINPSDEFISRTNLLGLSRNMGIA